MNDIGQTDNGIASNNQSADSSATVRLVPVTETYLVPVPWYKRVFGPVTRTETVWKLTFLSLLVVGVIVGQSMLQTPTNTVTQAAAGKARLALFPQAAEMPPDKPAQLWMTTDAPIKDAVIALSFDPNMLELNRDVILLGMEGYQVSVTPKSKANLTGVIEIKISPQSDTAPPVEGTVQLGSLFFSAKAPVTAATTMVKVNEFQSKILDKSKVPFSLTVDDLTVTLK